MKLATLLYIRNSRGDYLLMKRSRNPNKGLLSPPGGKLHAEDAESPSACAVREAYEECLITSSENDWKLLGIITEKNFPGSGNIMMFLMELEKDCDKIPPPCSEGEFSFIERGRIFDEDIPLTDRAYIWNRILESKENINPFIITIDCTNYPDLKLI